MSNPQIDVWKCEFCGHRFETPYNFHATITEPWLQMCCPECGTDCVHIEIPFPISEHDEPKEL